MPVANRLLLHVMIFSVGLLGIDQGVRKIGAGIADLNPVSEIVSRTDWDTVILGSCRAAILDAKNLELATQRRVLNAGRLAEGLGGIAFQWSQVLSLQTPKRVLVVLDNWVLETSQEEAKPEIRWHLDDWASLSPDFNEHIRKTFDVRASELLITKSGLWRYRGRGTSLLRGMLQLPIMSGGPLVPIGMGANDHSLSEQSLRVYEGRIRREWNPDPFAIAELEWLTRQSQKMGGHVTFLVSPMHRLQNTDEVNERVTKLAQEMANRLNIPIFNYLGNAEEFAKRDDWWAEPGHMTQAGATAFTRAVARDLAGAQL